MSSLSPMARQVLDRHRDGLYAPEDHPTYRAGHAARLSGASRNACPHGLHDLFKRCLWYAGFNDADMELTP